MYKFETFHKINKVIAKINYHVHANSTERMKPLFERVFLDMYKRVIEELFDDFGTDKKENMIKGMKCADDFSNI